MKKTKYYIMTFLTTFLLCFTVNASTTTYEDIPNNSYIIGTHLFTSNISLTTRHIMLGSKTINGSTLDDMQILYKNPRGRLVDGLTGNAETMNSTYLIDYEDSTTTIYGTVEDDYAITEYQNTEIPNNSYIIGKHLFTSNISLTTRHIMLGAKTIVGNTLDDMQILYKNPRGRWIDGLSGQSITPNNTYLIKFVDLVGREKSDGYITLSEYEKEIVYGTDSITFNVTGSHGGAITVNDDNSISEVTTNGNVVTVSNLENLGFGTIIKISVNCGPTYEYKAATITYTIRVNKAPMNVPEVSINTDGIVSWNNVPGASYYQISYNNIDFMTAVSGEETIPLPSANEDVQNLTVTAYVRAMPDDNHIPSNESGRATVNVYRLRLTSGANIESVTGAGYYVSGKTVSINATVSEGYKLASWTVLIGNTPSDNFHVTITENTHLSAVADKTKLYMRYNGNGGTWQGNESYTVNAEGTVIFSDSGSIYESSLSYGKELPEGGLIDYNSNWFNWILDGYSVPVEEEYFITNGDIINTVNQNSIYSAEDLASFGGCNLKLNDCTITLKVNWQTHLINDKDFIKTDGTNFVKTGINGATGSGEVVNLSGFSLNGWLSRDIDLSPVTNVSKDSCGNQDQNRFANEYTDDNIQINYALLRNMYESDITTIPNTEDTYLENYLDFSSTLLQSNRVYKKVFELNEAYYTNYISESDIIKLKEIGVTSIRVPIDWSYFVKVTKYIGPANKPEVNCGSYYNGMNVYDYEYNLLNGFDSSYNIISDSYLDRRMQHLDWIVEVCRRNGIYVVFDLHTVPGSVSADEVITQRGGAKFFEKNGNTYTAKSSKAQETTIKIWKLIAKRFAGNPGVAGYELLNEPSISNSEDTIKFYKTLYNEIRSIDNDHTIIMESPMCRSVSHYLEYHKENKDYYSEKETYCDTNNSSSMPLPSEYNWQNVSYSVHDYFHDNNVVPNFDGDEYPDDINGNNIPVFVTQTDPDGNLILNIDLDNDNIDDTNLDLDGDGKLDEPVYEKEDIIMAVKNKVNQIVEERNHFGVPIYIGETNWWWQAKDYTWPELIDYYQEKGLSYNYNTYKASNDDAYSLIYSPGSNFSKADLRTDNYDTLMNKFSMNTLNGGYINNSQNYYKVIKCGWNSTSSICDN